MIWTITKKIPIRPVELGYEAEVDDEDYEFLIQFRWSISKTKTTAYAKAQVGWQGEYLNIPMHRMVIGDAPEEWDAPFKEVLLRNGKTVFVISARFKHCRKKSVDHIDGNGMNNCRANLRHATCVEQVRNRRF